jgi:phage shock protein PspC (stress-responsive transcriptional regulator)
MAELRRPTTGRVIGGVCAALADRFGWNVTIVRLLVALSILLPGPQVLAYIIAWIVIPAEATVTVTTGPATAPAQPAG